jgi:multicomponent Na+:H+ antiporter subunit B
MKSLLLQTATRYLLPLLILFSVFLLVQGHHHPGGGFVGGLIAAAAIGLCGLAFDVPTALRIMAVQPYHLIGGGLLVAVASGLVGTFERGAFLAGVWGTINAGPFGRVELGTPLFFDAGVYLVVIGVTVTILLTLAEE